MDELRLNLINYLNLNVESLRDEYSSNSNGYNLNVGASSGGGKSAYIGYRIIKK